MSLVNKSLRASREIRNSRTRTTALVHLLTEVGELAQEVQIADIGSYKQPSPDGIVGEAVDAILCILDIIYLHDPDITEEELILIANKKIEKWKRTAK